VCPGKIDTVLASASAAAELLCVTVNGNELAPTGAGKVMVAVEVVPLPICACAKVMMGEEATTLNELLTADVSRGEVATRT